MNCSCENYLKSSEGGKFFVGDIVIVGVKDSCCFKGVKITAITSKGIYFDAGTKADKYIRADKIGRIELLGE